LIAVAMVVALITNALIAWAGSSRALQKLSLLLVGGFAIGEAISQFIPLPRQLATYAIADVIGMILCVLVARRGQRTKNLRWPIMGAYIGMLSLHLVTALMRPESHYGYYAGLNGLTMALIVTSMVWGLGIVIADIGNIYLHNLPDNRVAARHKVGRK